MFFQAFDAHSVCFDIDVFTLFLESVKGKISDDKQDACSFLKSFQCSLAKLLRNFNCLVLILGIETWISSIHAGCDGH